MKKLKKGWLGVGCALLMGGCASVEMAPYSVTSFAEVALKNHAKVKIVTNQDSLSPVVDSLVTEFGKSSQFKVVEEDADYWFVLNGSDQYVKSDPQKKISVVSKEDANGGTEVIAETTRNLSSASKGVSVAVYETKTLAPVHYFEIPIYAGDNTNGTVRSEAEYQNLFDKEVVERVKDVFLTQQKQVQTPMPVEANGELRDLFIQCGEEYAKTKDKRAYRPFLLKYKQVGVHDLKQVSEQLRTKTYEGPDPDQILGNYYLYLLVKEALTLDPAQLVKIKEEQAMILRSSDANGLAEAVPVALGRIEYKLMNLNK